MVVRTLPWLFALMLVLGGASSPIAAQCRLCAEPSTSPVKDDAAPVRIEVETALDFDRLVLTGAGSGTAYIGPDGSRQATGAVLSIGGRAMAGTITVRGEPGRAIRLVLPPSIRLFGISGGEARIDDIRSDLPTMPRIGSNGLLTVRFGGALRVDGALDGDLRGDFTVDVDYL